MINYNIPVLDTTNFQKGMEDREEKNQSTRLRNREALMKMSEQAAQNGQSLTYEDLARMSQDHLGSASFLSTTSPSASMFESMQATQNKQAERVTEVRRREAFDNTEKEAKAVEAYMSGGYANGVSDIEVFQGAQERFGAEVVGRTKIDHEKVRRSAERAAEKEGLLYGATMFSDVDEFNTYKASNGSVPKFELAAMQKAAEANEQARLAKIEAAATAIGNTGHVSAEAAEVELYAKIRNIAPKVSTEKLDKLVADGMKVVMATSDRKMAASAQEARTAGLKSLDANFVNNQQQVYKLEQAEEDRKMAQANARFQEGVGRIKSQVESVDAVTKDKKASPALKAELDSAMSSYAFMGGDAALYTQAVMTGNKAEAMKIRARAIPADQYLENVKATASIINGVHRFDTIEQAGSAFSGLGMSTMAITRLGQEIASNNSTFLKSVTDGEADVNSPGWWSEGLDITGESINPASSPIGAGGVPRAAVKPRSGANEMTETARITSENLLKGFKQNVGTFITDMTAAIGENGSVSASSEELKALAYKVALERSKALVGGMNLDSDEASEMAEKVASDIVGALPALVPITKKVSRAELFKQDIQRQRDGYMSPNGFEPNVSQPYPYAPRF